MGASRRVELLVGLGVVNQERCGGKAGPEAILQALQGVNNTLGSDPVDVPERSTEEGREAETEDGTHVAIKRGLKGLVLEAVDRLVHHSQHNTVLDLLSGRGSL